MNATAEPMKGSDYHRIEAAIRFLAEQSGAQPGLADVAAFLGLSGGHCQRLFHRWAGITPKDFLQVITLERAKSALRADRPLLAAAFDAGLSGTGRLHDLFLTIDAMTPGDFRRGGAGLTIAWGVHETPLGEAFVAVTDRGLCALWFVCATADRAALRERLVREWPAATFVTDATRTVAIADAVSERMRGRTHEPLALLLKGTPFQTKVWQALLAIPVNATVTYGELATRVGQPTASRAVGSAIGANPIGYLIPCHRVLRGTGAIGGYRWGAERKRAALILDSVACSRALPHPLSCG